MNEEVLMLGKWMKNITRSKYLDKELETIKGELEKKLDGLVKEKE